MKKQLLFFTLFLMPIFLLAQTKLEYKISKPYKVIDGEKYYASAKKGNLTFSLKKRKKEIHMQSFNTETMQEVKRNVFSDMPRGFEIENIIWVGNHLYLFYSIWDKPNKVEQLFVQEIDFKNCKFIGKAKRIIDVNGKLTGMSIGGIGFWSFGTVNKFSFFKSFDENKILIQCRKKPKKKSDAINHDKIGMYVFDANMDKIVGNEVEMPYTEKKMNNLDYHLNSEGTPYILAKVYNDNTTKESKKKGKNKFANYHIELLKVDIPANKITTTKVAVKDYFIKSIWLYDGADNNMYFSGFFSNKTDGKEIPNYEKSDGIFLIKADKNGGLLSETFHKIPEEVLNQYRRGNENKKSEKKKKKKAKSEFSSLKLRNLVRQKDGSCIIVGEQYYITAHRTSKGATYYTYHYNDILVTKINEKGELEWIKKLPKRQVGRVGKGGMGFKYLNRNDNHYFFFLDNVKNMSLPINKRPAVHGDGLGGYFTAYKIADKTGETDKLSIFNTKEPNNIKGLKLYQFNTSRILPINDNQIMIEFYKKQKEDVMVKVNLD